MDYATLSILFLLFALALLVAEFFIPSGGFLTLLMLIGLVISVWAAWKAWGKMPLVFWSYIGCLVVLLPSVVGTVVYLLPRTNFGRRVILDAPTPDDVVPYEEEQQRLAQYIGQRGVTKSLMTPGGIVLVDGERIHAESEGTVIEPDVEIEIIAVKHNRIVVRIPRHPAELDQNESGVDQFSEKEQSASEEENSSLDFDLPDA